ncbi:putative adipose-regulatory protein-domain-containing protein [Coniella lustricola]|uniref:Putative adipose-regulatory protein-domain-containing protein n=1 Tax=Coniella lustricola TaxID=2025994 RepID=A0A2T2ZSV5_9PEZI|nr:putative adipose-regulatory protein-domain-containing protein [Coniella lustricola]
MDLVNDGADALRSGYKSALQTAGSVRDVATSKTTQRTALMTVFLGLASTVLFGFAAVAYLAFYHEYLPDQVTTVPVHLQYGYEVNPYGVVSLADRKLRDYQEYDISVTLLVPNSPANLRRGNFMIAVHLVDDEKRQSFTSATTSGSSSSNNADRVLSPMTHPLSALEGRNILYTSTRPAIVPYTDPLVSLASRLLFLAYHVFVPASETTRLVVPMVERLEFVPGRLMPSALVLDVQAGQDLQVYSVSVTITAQLHGLRWFMHSWRVTAFLLLTTLFWLWEVCALCITVLVLRFVLGGDGGSGGSSSWPSGGKRIKQEDGRDKEQEQKEEQGQSKKVKQEAVEDVPMTFPTYSRQQPPLRYDPEPVHTNNVTATTPQADMPPPAGVEADDEYEDAGAMEEYFDNNNNNSNNNHSKKEDGDAHEDELDEGRDSGIGTSFSEMDRDPAVRVRRRTSRGRMGY